MNSYLIAACSLVSLLISIHGNAGELIGPPWSENFHQHVEQEYGVEAGKRLDFIEQFILDNRDLPVMQKLSIVNRTMNQLPWIADREHWKSSDYWATPLQTITTFGGDCEDIAIAKWFVLNHLAISNEHLRLVFVKLRTSRGTYGAHMVLIYLSAPHRPLDQQPVYILDNNVQEVKRANERPDLYAVHTVDVQGNVTLITENESGRSVKEVLKEREIRQLSELKKNIAADREKYLELSDGKYYMPVSL